MKFASTCRYGRLPFSVPPPGIDRASRATLRAAGLVLLAALLGLFPVRARAALILPPIITVPPLSQTVNAGANVTLTAVVLGSAPLTYQWRKNGANLMSIGNVSGTGTATLTLTNVYSGDSGVYSVHVSNPAGGASANAALTVRVPPKIYSPPLLQVVVAGQNAAFSVVASGTPPLSYQWRKNLLPILGATNAALYLLRVAAIDVGLYTVQVSNTAGTATSLSAALTVKIPPVIVLPPASQSAAPGSDVTLSVIATGTLPLSYQWQLNGEPLAGATNVSLTLPGVEITNSGAYNVVVSSPDGATKSAAAIVSVIGPDIFLANNFASRVITNSASDLGRGSNVNATAESGEPRHADRAANRSVWLTWRAPASGNVAFSTRGSDFDTVLAAYTGASLATLAEVASDDDSAGNYASVLRFNAQAGTDYHIAMDGASGASGRIVLGWEFSAGVEPPRVTAQPASQTVTAGQDAVFSVTAAGAGSLRYQWFRNGAAITDATNSSLTVAGVQSASVGAYSASVTDENDRAVFSRAANLEIGPNPAAQTQLKFSDLFAESGAGGFAASPAKVRHPQPASYPSVSAGAVGTQIFDNYNSGSEPGEPPPAGVSGNASRWFSLTASENGMLLIDTIGSEIDTVLAVYTGDDIYALNLVASDDNGAPDGIRSRVLFPATQGTTYHLGVYGRDEQQGTAALNWRLGVPPAFTLTPPDGKATVGERVELAAQADGVPVPAFAWRKDEAALPAQTAASIVFDPVLGAHAGVYDVVVSNFAGLAISGPAHLSVSAAFRLVNLTRTGTNFSLAIPTDSGVTYGLEYNSNLRVADGWVPVGSTFLGDGQPKFFNHNPGAVNQGYYRIRVY